MSRKVHGHPTPESLPGGAAAVPPEVHRGEGERSVYAPAVPPPTLVHAFRCALEALDLRDVGEARRVLLDPLAMLSEGSA